MQAMMVPILVKRIVWRLIWIKGWSRSWREKTIQLCLPDPVISHLKQGEALAPTLREIQEADGDRYAVLDFIVTVFAGSLYGHRAQGVRKRVETVLKECEQEERANGTGQPHHQAAP